MNEEPNNPEQHEANKAQRLNRDLNTHQVPSVGRFCHYFAYGSAGGEFPAGVPRAAVITEVDDPGNPFSAVGLAVFNPTGLFFNQHIEYGPGRGGHWGWQTYAPPVVISASSERESAE